MGGSICECPQCGQRKYHYHSCRDRHCPTCHAKARAEWLAAREAEVLPTNYFHVVFTLPKKLQALALWNRTVMFGLLLRVAGRTLVELSERADMLDATPGVLTLLHTWGGNLSFHPHAHCVVTGGGLTTDGEHWKTAPGGEDFFLPVSMLWQKFRGKFLAELKKAHAKGKLRFSATQQYLNNPRCFNAWLRPLYRKYWHAYAKPPFGGPTQTLKYLARYVQGVALHNARLLRLTDDQVTFVSKNHAVPDGQQVVTLKLPDFLQRFIQHILPCGFTRCRYYGVWSNRNRAERLDRCRSLMGNSTTVQEEPHPPVEEESKQPDEPPALRCQHCGHAPMTLWAVAEPPTRQELLSGRLTSWRCFPKPIRGP